MAFAEVKVFSSRLEAEMVQEVLKSAGVPSLIQSDEIAIFGPGHLDAPSGAKLLVREEDLLRAKGLLQGMI